MKKCTNCGAYLDPQEICDCEQNIKVYVIKKRFIDKDNNRLFVPGTRAEFEKEKAKRFQSHNLIAPA